MLDPFFNTQTSSFFASQTQDIPYRCDDLLDDDEGNGDDDPIVREYIESVRTSGIEGIMTIKDLITNRNSSEMIVGCVYGIVRRVRDVDIPKQKQILLVDPTRRSGIEIITQRKSDSIPVQKIMKIQNFKLIPPNYVLDRFTEWHTIPLFSFNYDAIPEEDTDETNIRLKRDVFSDPRDIQVCRCLERWYSEEILSQGLSTLPPLPEPGQPKNYVDICCQVLAYNVNDLCINALVWDGTKPKHDPAPSVVDHWDKLNLEHYSIPTALKIAFPLTIWSDKNQAVHTKIFETLTLKENNDLVVMFNVELEQKPSGAGLLMRSRVGYGKAIRLCRDKSILGQLFNHKLERFRSGFLQRNLSSLTERLSPLIQRTIIERVSGSGTPSENGLTESQSSASNQVPREDTIMSDDSSISGAVIEVQVETNGDNIENIRCIPHTGRSSPFEAPSTAFTSEDRTIDNEEERMDQGSQDSIHSSVTEYVEVEQILQQCPKPMSRPPTNPQPIPGPSGILWVEKSFEQKSLELKLRYQYGIRLKALFRMGEEKLLNFRELLLRKCGCTDLPSDLVTKKTRVNLIEIALYDVKKEKKFLEAKRKRVAERDSSIDSIMTNDTI
ncbi:uncharacterized protein LOC141853950 [Brevipalpus obovatus]|uniref:uncharacterized protein LOC141853950 n=1 Tax=Brevipalpus obovatus TaxID=246614 RepID=UPI003D9E8A6F